MSSKAEAVPSAVPAYQNSIRLDATTGFYQIAQWPEPREWKFPASYTANADGTQRVNINIDDGNPMYLKGGEQTITGRGRRVYIGWELGTSPSPYFHIDANPDNKVSVYDDWPRRVAKHHDGHSFFFSLDNATKRNASWDLQIDIASVSGSTQFEIVPNGGPMLPLSTGPQRRTISSTDNVGLYITNLEGEVKIEYTLTELA
jgi:hypothetical protein